MPSFGHSDKKGKQNVGSACSLKISVDGSPAMAGGPNTENIFSKLHYYTVLCSPGIAVLLVSEYLCPSPSPSLL